MKKGDLFRCLGILMYVILTFLDRFCFDIVDFIYIPVALVGIILIIVGFIVEKNIDKNKEK